MMSPRQSPSMLCPGCRKLLNREAPFCPHCGMQRLGSWWKRLTLRGWLHDPNQVVKVLIGINAGMYIISLLVSPRSFQVSFDLLTTLSPSNQSLLQLGATGTIPIDHLQRWWTLLSANYLHGGILHILFNMLALRQLIPLVGHLYGINRLIVLYTLTGVAGFWVSYVAGVPFTIGASAALCGLIGATLYYGKSRGGLFGEAIYRQIGGWAIGIFVIGLLIPGINNWGHGGGMAAGALLGFLVGYRERSDEQPWHTMLAAVCMAATGLVLAWMLLSSIWPYTMG
jgi:rhomboid protease GluP